MKPISVITVNEQLSEQVVSWFRKGETLAFVPTMGNLHKGHLKLVEVARQHADRMLVSIFVNPMQFNQASDFSNYPRTLETDLKSLEPLDVDVVYCPDENAIYPEGIENSAKINVPGLTEMLCGAYRPGHFEGVATVVAKLFNLVRPQVAVFGEKDYQQLLVIKKLVKDLNFPVSILSVETQRESNGLALSSRNQYLTAEELQTASQLYSVLIAVADKAKNRCRPGCDGLRDFADLERDAMQQLADAGFRPEYVEIRSADNLEPGAVTDKNLRVFAAAWLGQARLIDNVPVELL